MNERPQEADHPVQLTFVDLDGETRVLSDTAALLGGQERRLFSDTVLVWAEPTLVRGATRRWSTFSCQVLMLISLALRLCSALTCNSCPRMQDEALTEVAEAAGAENLTCPASQGGMSRLPSRAIVVLPSPTDAVPPGLEAHPRITHDRAIVSAMGVLSVENVVY